MSFPRQPFDFFSERRSKVFTLHTPHFTLHSSHSKLQTSHSTLHTSHFTLLPSHSKPHTSHFTLRSSHSKLKLHTSHFTLHTSHFSLPSQPSHRRGRSSRFGDGLCMEKHKVSCICYLSKTHFVRDFLQNSIGNSSTNTTCTAICIAGTILQLQITMEFHRQLIHQHHLQSHLHCGNDPTVANHNGILSTAHARKAVETPFTMRNRSEHDPNMIRE